MNIKQLANLLGGTVNGQWVNIPGPGHSASDRSLGITLDAAAPDGFVLKSFAGDDLQICRAHVKRLLVQGCAEPVDKSPRPNTTSSDQLERTRQALKVWEQASLPEGTLVERYLNARSCKLMPFLREGSSIRFHARCPFGKERVPAMVALMRDILTDEPTGVHRTALKNDGAGKRETSGPAKRMFGPATGAAVKLQPYADILGIAEGIETALSAAQLFGVPTWALLSAGGIATCPVIRTLKKLIIFADNDKAGIDAAKCCAKRYAKSGIAAEVCSPREQQIDWNDVIRKWKSDGN